MAKGKLEINLDIAKMPANMLMKISESKRLEFKYVELPVDEIEKIGRYELVDHILRYIKDHEDDFFVFSAMAYEDGSVTVSAELNICLSELFK